MLIAAKHNLIFVGIVYLQAPINFDIDMEQPGVNSKDGEKLVFKLQKSLYGFEKKTDGNGNGIQY